MTPSLTTQLQDAIRQSGLSHYRIAKLAEVDRRIVDRFMRNETSLLMDNADSIARAIGVEWAPVRCECNAG